MFPQHLQYSIPFTTSLSPSTTILPLLIPHELHWPPGCFFNTAKPASTSGPLHLLFSLLWTLAPIPSIPVAVFLTYFFNPHRRYVLLTLEKEKGEVERERETLMWDRNIDWLPSICTPNRDWTHNLGMCSDRGPNLQTFGVWDDTPTNLVTQSGLFSLF